MRSTATAPTTRHRVCVDDGVAEFRGCECGSGGVVKGAAEVEKDGIKDVCKESMNIKKMYICLFTCKPWNPKYKEKSSKKEKNRSTQRTSLLSFSRFDNATAIFAPMRILFLTNPTFEVKLLPSVICRMRSSKNGVMSLPFICASFAAITASSIAESISAVGIAYSGGGGTQKSKPDCSWRSVFASAKIQTRQVSKLKRKETLVK